MIQLFCKLLILFIHLNKINNLYTIKNKAQLINDMKQREEKNLTSVPFSTKIKPCYNNTSINRLKN